MARPEILFPLFAGIDGLRGVGPKSVRSFERLGIERMRDLLFHLPTGVVDRRPVERLEGIPPGTTVTLEVLVKSHQPPRRPGRPYRVSVEGAGTLLELVFFRSDGGWLGTKLPVGQQRVVSGRLDLYDGRWQIAHPDHMLSVEEAASLPPFEPVYGTTEGLTSAAVARAAAAALEALSDLPEWNDPALAKREGWPPWSAALSAMHRPEAPVGQGDQPAARRRLAFDELLSHQLALALARSAMRRGRGQETVEPAEAALSPAIRERFGYQPTAAQERVLGEIAADMAAPDRMMRLLQGDVGAGKTWVAALATAIAAAAGGQGALMAPTEILARQHAANLTPVMSSAGVEVVLLTGRDRGSARATKLAAIADGRAKLVIGTHALFSGDVAFADLRLAVIDEQHRFGVRQRMELSAKAPRGCDLLIMTATPIPRTLALAGYGDLDISILDEKPPGRSPIDTRLISADRLDDVVERLGAVLAAGRRAYWVCPAVEDRPDSDAVAAEARAQMLAGRLGLEHVALVHGQMPAEAKDGAMEAFQSGARRLLVATTVIEVGVDVPEATIMVVEQADRFGLAQLHQLRGRVGRGAGQSHCLLLYDAPLGETAVARLAILRDSEDGFRIAEEDLRLRGAGDVIGTAQSGLPRFRLADLERDTALMEIARDDARRILATDPTLTSPRGEALKVLLYLMERDASVRLLKSG
ncbi:MAG: ATP-dependent DNA helicase RecG [Pseudomonadota bacterium]